MIRIYLVCLPYWIFVDYIFVQCSATIEAIYYNKEPEQRCMTDHRIKNNPLSSFENKQRSVSNISYMVFGHNRNYSAILATLQITSYALGA
jgi:hypothetical protein